MLYDKQKMLAIHSLSVMGMVENLPMIFYIETDRIIIGFQPINHNQTRGNNAEQNDNLLHSIDMAVTTALIESNIRYHREPYTNYDATLAGLRFEIMLSHLHESM